MLFGNWKKKKKRRRFVVRLKRFEKNNFGKKNSFRFDWQSNEKPSVEFDRFAFAGLFFFFL